MIGFGIIPVAATYMRYPLWTACNVAHPMWQRWRGGTGYFVIEHNAIARIRHSALRHTERDRKEQYSGCADELRGDADTPYRVTHTKGVQISTEC